MSTKRRSPSCSEARFPPGRWRRLRASLWLVAPLAATPSAAAQYIAPTGPDLRVNQNTSFNQYWVRVATDPAAQLRGFSFSGGQEVFARFFLGESPITGDVQCNTAFVSGIQDEPEIGWSVDDRFLVAWSERSGADGEEMGIFGRIYDDQGQPLSGAEFQINVTWQASQWRPLIAAHPDGSWVVAWSGDWDGDALFRRVGSNGAFLTGEVPVDTIGNGAQVDTAPAVAPDGTTFVCFVDYSGFGGIGSGTNLWYRMFDAASNPLSASESPLLPAAASVQDQREPRVCADGLGRFVVVWEDEQADGSGWGIFGRRFSPLGAPLGPVFPVNTTTTGNQRSPRVAADESGRFVVCWTDFSGSSPDVIARHFDASGQPASAEFRVHAAAGGTQELPSVALDQSGATLVFCYEGPGVQDDVFTRSYTTVLAPTPYCTAGISGSGCQAQISANGSPSASASSGFSLTASGVEGSKDGLFFFGSNGRQANPWGNGSSFQCVVPPVLRAGLLTGSGSQGACDGSFAQDMNALWCPSCPKPAKNPGPGTLVQAQLWYRDPTSTSNQTTSLSDAIEFTVQP